MQPFTTQAMILLIGDADVTARCLEITRSKQAADRSVNKLQIAAFGIVAGYRMAVV